MEKTKREIEKNEYYGVKPEFTEEVKDRFRQQEKAYNKLLEYIEKKEKELLWFKPFTFLY